MPGGGIMTGPQQDRKRFDEISKPEQTGLNLSFRGEKDNEGCPWVRSELTSQQHVNGNICAQNW